AQLRDEGVIGAIGAGMNQSAMLTRFLRETAADLVMLAGRYTLLDQSALDSVLPAAVEHGKSVVAVGVFNSGLLSRPRPAEGMKYDYQDDQPELVERARAIAEVCEHHGPTPPSSTSPSGCEARSRCCGTRSCTTSAFPTPSGTT